YSVFYLDSMVFSGGVRSKVFPFDRLLCPLLCFLINELHDLADAISGLSSPMRCSASVAVIHDHTSIGESQSSRVSINSSTGSFDVYISLLLFSSAISSGVK